MLGVFFINYILINYIYLYSLNINNITLSSNNQISILLKKDEDLSAGNQILQCNKVGTSETIRTLTVKQKE